MLVPVCKKSKGMSKGKYVKRTFPLAGLHCAGCAARVEKILNAQTGVVAASVNLAASTAAVEYDTMQTSPERLRQAVQEGGYDMLADSDDDTPDELERMNRERYRDLKRRAFWAVVLAIPVVVIGMFFMDMPYGGAIMALLSAPVVFWLGRGFFVNAWQQLRHRSATMDTLVALSTGIAYPVQSVQPRFSGVLALAGSGTSRLFRSCGGDHRLHPAGAHARREG